jgi:hypothetical protein
VIQEQLEDSICRAESTYLDFLLQAMMELVPWEKGN